MAGSTPRGAIFDWDGVIINSAEHHRVSWDRLAAETGYVLPDGHFERGFGMKNDVIIPELLGWTTEPVEIQKLSLRKEAIWREAVREMGIKPLPGVVPWLDTLEAEKIPCVIASSTHRENITTTLEIIGLGKYFAAIVSAEDVSRGKPDPEVFLTAGQRIGIALKGSVVFEDALVGIAAARAAKMKVVAVATTHTPEALHEADWVVHQLDELSVVKLWGE